MVQKALQYGILAFALLVISPATGRADLDDIPVLEETGKVLEVSTGYRWVSTDNNPDRAAEYSYLDDSPTFNLIYKEHFGDRNFSLVGEFVNDNDFFVEADFDYKSLFRLNTLSERLYHNLDHIPYQNNPEAREDTPNISFTDQNPGTDYGRRITIHEVKMRGKLPTYPAHINLAYWRMEKKSKEQLRFVDENCAGACHMQSRTRKTDRVTEEITAGIDAHLGPIDIAFLQTLREFREKEDTPVDYFGPAAAGPPNPLREEGRYIHDESPEASLTESTVMVNLPPSGGFVSSASYTIGKRENDSNLKVVKPVDSETDYQKLAADATYTPGENWTFNFRYRMLDMDSDVPSTQISDGVLAFDGQVPVRQSIDIDRDNYSAFVSYRPSRRLTFKGEFEHENLERNNTGIGQHRTLPGIADLTWALPDTEETNRLRLTFFARLLEKSALKLSGWYEHQDVTDPAYSTTLSNSNELFFSASYKPSAIWGMTANIDILRGDNDDQTVVQFDNGEQVLFNPDRDEERENLSLGLWFVPSETFSADFNYGLLHSKVDQDVLFGASPDTTDPGGLTDYTIMDDDTDYEQKVHTLAIGLNLRATDNVNCRLEGYHIRSTSEFSPGFAPASFDYSAGADQATSDELQEISEVDLQQNGLKARIRWKLSEMLTAGLVYTFDDYEDHNSSAFDGTAQTFVASLTGVF